MAIVLGLNYRIMRSKFAGGKFRRWWTSGDGYVTAWYIVCTVVKLPSLIDNLHRCFSILFFSAPLKERRREEERKEKCTSRTLSRNAHPNGGKFTNFSMKLCYDSTNGLLNFFSGNYSCRHRSRLVHRGETHGETQPSTSLLITRILNAPYFPGCCSSPARFSTSFAFVLALTSFSIKLATFNRPVV